MGRAVTEMAVGGALIGGSFLVPGLGPALLAAGFSMVAAGALSELRGNQGGISIGTTTPIGPWQYVYGTQKVGGVKIFEQSNSSQGTSNDKELHRVYELACHPCVGGAGTFQLRIDGKQVLLSAAGPGWVSYSPTQVQIGITSMTRDIYGVVTVTLSSAAPSGLDGTSVQITEAPDNTFNGIVIVTEIDSTHFSFVSGGTATTVSGGQFWTLYADYQDKIYVEWLNGNHTATFAGLLASGTNWGATDLRLGRTLVYVRMGYDEGVFPSAIPNVSFVFQGKNNIFDPRTSTYGFTNNAVLCIADYMSLASTIGGYGLAIGAQQSTAQVIAGANVCDEAVALAGGGTTPRYTCDTTILLTEGRGSILEKLLTSCAGRLSYQGFTYDIFPGAALAATLQLTDADIYSIRSTPRLSIRDTCNAVKGTYVSPENGYQMADFPYYAADVAHGYTADLWLAEDRGERIFKEINLPCTALSAIAQRLGKIALWRTRFQGRYTIRATMKAYQAVALDVIQITHPRYTWLLQTFEVLSSRLVMEKSKGALTLAVELDLADTDPSIFDWVATEQLTPQGYAQPDNVGNSVCQPPDDVTLYSGPGAVVGGITYPSTITTGADGTQTNSLYVRWNQPNDANVVHGGHLEVQWQLAGATPFTAWGKFDPSVSAALITPVSEGSSYNVQVRAVNSAGVPSKWILAGPELISDTYSVFSYSGVAVAPPGTLTAQGLVGGTANIGIFPFTPSVYAAACTPSPNILTGLNQAQVYWVYYIDPTYAGGAITPIATQNVADFEDKVGYFLIGQITTPTYAPRYQPSANTPSGTATVSSPGAAYDNNIATDAIVPANWFSVIHIGGPPTFTVTYTYAAAAAACQWSGFPAYTTAAVATLNIYAAITEAGTVAGASCVLSATIAGVTTVIATITAATAVTDYTLSIPSGTDLSTVTVQVSSSLTTGSSPGYGNVSVDVFEIYIQ